jgi:hypothetical protein
MALGEVARLKAAREIVAGDTGNKTHARARIAALLMSIYRDCGLNLARTRFPFGGGS